ncbi:hypothetical protein [Saccharopolyspora sp. NPDC049357]
MGLSSVEIRHWSSVLALVTWLGLRGHRLLRRPEQQREPAGQS